MEIADKMVSFGADGAPVFQGVRTGVVQQFADKHAPYSLGIHCVAHKTDIAVGPLSNLPIVTKIEELVTSLHAYFFNCPNDMLSLLDCPTF